MARNREGKKIKPITYKAIRGSKQKMEIIALHLMRHCPQKTTMPTHTRKQTKKLDNCKAAFLIELNTLKQIFGDIKNKYHLEPKTKNKNEQKSIKKCNENGSISEEEWEKKMTKSLLKLRINCKMLKRVWICAKMYKETLKKHQKIKEWKSDWVKNVRR